MSQFRETHGCVTRPTGALGEVFPGGGWNRPDQERRNASERKAGLSLPGIRGPVPQVGRRIAAGPVAPGAGRDREGLKPVAWVKRYTGGGDPPLRSGPRRKRRLHRQSLQIIDHRIPKKRYRDRALGINWGDIVSGGRAGDGGLTTNDVVFPGKNRRCGGRYNAPYAKWKAFS